MPSLSQTEVAPVASARRPTQVAVVTPPFLARPVPPRDTGPRSDPRRVGPYRLLRKLGEGGMGVVYLAYDTPRRQPVAIKVLSPEHAAVPDYLARFRQEGRHGTDLDHPHLVRTYAIGHDPAADLHYLVLEYIDGPSAQELLDRHDRLPVGDAVAIVHDIAQALVYTHARAVIHRDIKPGNILLTAAGAAKLADLGLAKKLDEPSLTQTATHQGFGTPYYVAPEQALNARNADTRSDLYALGATLYHLLTGAVPFPGGSQVEVVEKKVIGDYAPARSFNPAVPEALDAVLLRLLAREPRDRYLSAAGLIADLERLRLATVAPSVVLDLNSPTHPGRHPLLTTSPALHHPSLVVGVREGLSSLGAKIRALLP